MANTIKSSRADLRTQVGGPLFRYALPALLVSAVGGCGSSAEPSNDESSQATQEPATPSEVEGAPAPPAEDLGTPADGTPLEDTPLEGTTDPRRVPLRESGLAPAEWDYGQWVQTGTYNCLAIHAALMPPETTSTSSPAKVLLFGGSQHDQAWPQWPTGAPLGQSCYGLFNTSTRTVSGLTFNGTTRPNPPDLFCSGHTHDKDGRLIIAGGTEYYAQPGAGTPGPTGGWTTLIPYATAPTAECLGDPGWVINIHRCPSNNHWGGRKATWRFNFSNLGNSLVNSFTAGPNMQFGRWYPTLVRGASATGADIIAMGGHPSAADPWHDNWNLDTMTTTGSPWTFRTQAVVPLYPRAHMTQFGLVVASHLSGQTVKYDPTTWVQQTLNAGPPFQYTNSFAMSSVLMPLRPNAAGVYDSAKIIMTNAVDPVFMDVQWAGNGWQYTGPIPNYWGGGWPEYRYNAVATLLFTGDLLVSGGVTVGYNDGAHGTPDTSKYFPDYFRDDLQEWKMVGGEFGGATVPRNYHSVALLLPDGSVWTAGGNKHAGYAVTGQPGCVNGVCGPQGDGRETRWEIFEPWYVNASGRPTFGSTTAAPPAGGGNWTFSTASGTGQSITRVALIAPGSVTHSFDSDQRYVELRIVSKTSSSVTVSVPSDQKVLPRGMYMLVISKANTVTPILGPYLPSRARWVKVT